MKNNKNVNNQIFDILNNEIFTSKFISGIAGDKISSKEDKNIFDKLLKEMGDDIYVKILFFMTHQMFPSYKAKKLWKEIINHKYKISKTLKRNIEITVAALDYLTNIKNEIENPKLIGEAFIGKIVEMSSIDSLTKLYNRTYFFVKIKEELKRFKRYKTTFSLVILDIDDFKKVNDQFGHQKGDEVLSKLGFILDKSKRELDICARYGGEEFALILPHTDSNEAKIISERIRKKIERYFKKDIKITISIGLANCPESSTTIKSLIKKTDEALYESKKRGKNQITFK